MNQPPVSQDIAAAFGKFFFGGIGPTHTDLTGVFLGAGLSDVAPAPRGSQSKQGPNKQERVQRTVLAAIRKPQYARTLVDGLLSALRTHGAVVEGTPQFDKANTEVLRRALARQGWNLAPDGHMTPIGAIDLETGGREALDDQIRRLRQNTDDPALLLGTAKELLESVAKFVLQELRVQGSGQNLNFNKLWHLARKWLAMARAVKPSRPFWTPLGRSWNRSTCLGIYRERATAELFRLGSLLNRLSSLFVKLVVSPSLR